MGGELEAVGDDDDDDDQVGKGEADGRFEAKLDEAEEAEMAQAECKRQQDILDSCDHRHCPRQELDYLMRDAGPRRE